jgi:sterol desaturase/sphingolipid hydroxylase (fatty acid hydroxylase superfamily)
VHEFLHLALGSFTDRVWQVCYVGLTLLAFEWLMPRSRYSLTSRVRAVIFWVSYLAVTASALTLFTQLWSKLGITPMFVLKIGELFKSDILALQVIGWVVSLTLASTVGEFFYYWFHRLQHANAFLWRFHSVHHSLRELSALNSNHHFTEEIFRIPFITIPVSVVIAPDPGYIPPIFATIFGFQGLFEHSSSKLHLGPLRYITGDTRFHRIHHSMNKEHHNKNFGSFLTIWDSLFGTAYWPRPDEWPATGLTDVDEPKTIRDFFTRPFRNQVSRPPKLEDSTNISRSISPPPPRPTPAATNW